MPEVETQVQTTTTNDTTGTVVGAGNGSAKTVDTRAEIAARQERERQSITEKTRVEVLRELGLDNDDAMARFRAHREDAEKQRPEIEKKEREWKRQYEGVAKERDDLTAQVRTANEAYLSLLMRSYAGDLARSIDAHDSAVPDIETWLDAHTITEGEGEDATLVVTDGDFRIEYDSKEFSKSLAEHLRKTKPHYSRSRIVGGAGTGAAGSATGPKTAPTNLDELAAAFARKAAGGR